ncbi:MAG: pyridoxal phosphate-dependent aminotransferase [Phycisphaerae bacterium]|nr:pyridoxal phosphate-dependent aminotransferase [Phycisphaerae bacterium]
MSISEIAKSIGESATLKLNATAAALRAKGEPVIHLGGGEPKSKAPHDALTSAAALLNTGEVRYTPADGIPALKQAIIDYTEEFYRHRVEPRNVMASGGAKQAIMVALQTVLNPGDEVIFPVPYWVSYPDMARLCGAVPVPVLPADGSYYPCLDDIEQSVTAKTRVVIINSPNNPSGAMYSAEFIRDVVRFCERQDLYLIMDDIYQRLIFDGRKAISCFDFAEEKGDESKLIAVNGVSKQYAMTGFRLGWAVASAPLIKVMGRIQGHQTSGPSALSQQAAIGALTGDQSSVEDLRTTLENNRDILMDQLSGIEGVKVTKPDGTFYSLVDFRHYEEDSLKLAQYLIEEARVVTIPGVAFGLDGHLRISYCGSISDITQGIERIKLAVASYSPKESSQRSARAADLESLTEPRA